MKRELNNRVVLVMYNSSHAMSKLYLHFHLAERCARNSLDDIHVVVCNTMIQGEMVR